MSTLSKHLKNSMQPEPVNESLIFGAIVATACLGYAVGPMLNNDFFKSVGAGLGGLLGGLGAMFGGFGQRAANKKEDDDKDEKKDSNKDDDKDEKKDSNKDDDKDEKKDSNKDDDNSKNSANITSGLLMLAKKANENEKDKTKKAETESLINLISACSYDKDGNEVPMEERMNKLKDMVPEDQFEDFKKKMEKTVEDNKDSKEFKDALEKAKKDISEKYIETYLTEAKEQAKKTLAEIAKQKEEQEKIDKEVKELEEKLKNADDDKKGEIEKQLKAKKEEQTNVQTTSIVGTALTAVGIKPKQEQEKEQEKESDEETDEEGNIVKDEEITDPETGKKIKVKTHTGPRGGKFYYPDGKPKTPENKVYVESKSYSDFSNHLKFIFG